VTGFSRRAVEASESGHRVRRHIPVLSVGSFVRTRTGPLVVLAVLFTLAGCAGLGSIGPEVTDEEARERALAAEERHISDHLRNASCVESWSPDSYVGIERDATVTNRTASGVSVTVRHSFTYSTDRTEADVASEARYLVTADEVVRLSGTDVAPC
jgi:hypothetical protein